MKCYGNYDYYDDVEADRRDQYAAYPDLANPTHSSAPSLFEDAGTIEGVQYVQVSGFCFPFESSGDAFGDAIHRERSKDYEYIYLRKFKPICFGWRKRGDTLWIGERNRLRCGGPEEVKRALAAGEFHKDLLGEE